MDAESRRVDALRDRLLDGTDAARRGLRQWRPDAPHSAQSERQLQFRGRRIPDHGHQGRRGVVRFGVHVGIAGAVVRAARARAAATNWRIARFASRSAASPPRQKSTRWCRQVQDTVAEATRVEPAVGHASRGDRPRYHSNGPRIDRRPLRCASLCPFTSTSALRYRFVLPRDQMRQDRASHDLRWSTSRSTTEHSALNSVLRHAFEQHVVDALLPRGQLLEQFRRRPRSSSSRILRLSSGSERLSITPSFLELSGFDQ